MLLPRADIVTALLKSAIPREPNRGLLLYFDRIFSKITDTWCESPKPHERLVTGEQNMNNITHKVLFVHGLING